MAPIASIDAMMKDATPEQQKAGMDDWMAWMGKHKDMITDMGNPTGKNMRVTSAGVGDVRNDVCGYTIVHADSHEAAAALFTDSPHLAMDSAHIEILECVPVETM